MNQQPSIDDRLDEILLAYFEYIQSSYDASNTSKIVLDRFQAKEAIKQLILSERLDENAWARGQMIAWQAYEAPNSGFGRMVKSAIKLLNERKAKLLKLSNPTQENN